ncbi:MAG: PBSX family phage terminase large subunit [Gordonibacter sp.]
MRSVSLNRVVGLGYSSFWHSRKTYVVCKGSRASKKSKTAALWHVFNIMKYPESNALVVRKVERTLRDSAFSDIKWAIHRFGVDHLWSCTTSPLECTYLPTGQKVLFRGMDDPLKLASVSVPRGVLNFLWVEEAYEIMNESAFDTLDESIRGKLPEGYFKRVTLTFNPWNDRHWLKARFFDHAADDVLAMTTNYTVNEWLSPTDLKLFESMKVRNPRRYQVAGLGTWGVVDGLVYESWAERDFSLEEVRDTYPKAVSVYGLDFGYTNDPSALFCGLYDRASGQLWVFDEMYKTGMSNKAIAAEITRLGYGKERITADSAEPKSIDELKGLGLRVRPAVKGRDSVRSGIQFVQDLRIWIHPRCSNFITEIGNYVWDKDRNGKALNVPIDDFNHLLDAMRYGMEKHIKGDGWLI